MCIILGFLFIASCLGYSLFFLRQVKLCVNFIPITVVSTLSLVLYLFGLLGLLFPGAVALYSVGLLLFGISVFQYRKNRPPVCQPKLFDICFVIVAGIFLILSLNMKLQHYDNFSHWAIVVKNMLTNDRFPNMTDFIVSYKDYPLGISTWLYYVCRFWGHQEGILLFGQNLFLLCAFYAVFAVIREKRRILVYTFLATGFSMLSYLNMTIRINNLLVDFHLPILALAGIAVVEHYRYNPGKDIWVLVPLLGVTAVVKNTGILFAFIPIVYLFFVTITQKGSRRELVKIFAIAALVSLPFVLWQYHEATALAGLDKKFSLTQGGVGQTVAPEDYSQIISDFISSALNPGGRAAQVFYLSNAAVIACSLYALVIHKRKLRLLCVLPVLDFLVVAYYGGILCLYLFVMPAGEARILAGFERYACSIILFFAGALLFTAVRDIEHSFHIQNPQGALYKAFLSPKTKKNYQAAVFMTAILSFNFLYSELSGLWFIRSAYDRSIAGQALATVGDHWYQGTTDNTRYLVVANDQGSKVSSYELSFTLRYFLYDSEVWVVEPMKVQDLKKMLFDYDQIILFDNNVIRGVNRETMLQLRQKKIWTPEELAALLNEQ